MGKTILSEIWKIRRVLDKAVYDGDAKTILELKEEYENLINNTSYSNDVFTSYNFVFSKEKTIKKHFDLNKNEIALDLDLSYKKIAEPEAYIKSKKNKVVQKTKCLAVEIWIIRAMFDDFILNTKYVKNYDSKENMALGKAIIKRLEGLSVASKYSGDIKSFIRDVKDVYKKLYGEELASER